MFASPKMFSVSSRCVIKSTQQGWSITHDLVTKRQQDMDLLNTLLVQRPNMRNYKCFLIRPNLLAGSLLLTAMSSDGPLSAIPALDTYPGDAE
jgi:hypothetical protein